MDAKGLVALWREGLLAQDVLRGNTKGYRNHPQLTRFKNSSNPLGAIASYLRDVHREATRRGYAFDRSKIPNKRMRGRIPVTAGQLGYEHRHLLRKLRTRDRKRYATLKSVSRLRAHPLFRRIRGDVEPWEIR